MHLNEIVKLVNDMIAINLIDEASRDNQIKEMMLWKDVKSFKIMKEFVESYNGKPLP